MAKTMWREPSATVLVAYIHQGSKVAQMASINAANPTVRGWIVARLTVSSASDRGDENF